MKATSEMFVPYVLSRFYNPKRKMKRKKAKKKQQHLFSVENFNKRPALTMKGK